MPTYADLEITLRRRDEERYLIDLSFSQPDGESVISPLQQMPGLKLDLKALRQHHLNNDDYGRALTGQLFGDPELRSAFSQARAVTHSLNVPLRLRLRIDGSAPELHGLRWESLRDPDDPAATLLTGEQLLFSRYLHSHDWRPVRPRAKRELKALVAVAGPIDLDPDQLALVEVEAELSQALAGLGDFQTTALARGLDPTQFPAIDLSGTASLDQIQDRLRVGYDILYLICHGAQEDEALLWLEDSTGQAEVVSGQALVTHLKELEQRPRLVVLASCQSAGSGGQARTNDEGALAALGPRLAEAGIPAVLAMQGNVSMKTVEQFMPVFFKNLREDGQIDRAVALARAAVRARPDWWMPVLYMRLKSGRLWYTPGFAGSREAGLDKWPALRDSILDEACTPILGPGLTDFLYGSRREIAEHLADEYGFPLAPDDRDDLPQVAQYLSVRYSPKFLPRRVIRQLGEEILQRHRPHLPAEPGDLSLEDMGRRQLFERVARLAGVIGRQQREIRPAEPHRVLAQLPFRIYISADPGDLLVQALREAGKEPRVEFCRWKASLETLPTLEAREPDYYPDVDGPLVFHLFGMLEEPDSLVLTEDDYFDFLIGVTGNKDLIPLAVRSALADSALLFLGFQMDDWNFRVLFRSILGREGSFRLGEYAHIAVQVTPEEDRIIEPEQARKFLESYFQKVADITIYWGSSEDFIDDLYQKWHWPT